MPIPETDPRFSIEVIEAANASVIPVRRIVTVTSPDNRFSVAIAESATSQDGMVALFDRDPQVENPEYAAFLAEARPIGENKMNQLMSPVGIFEAIALRENLSAETSEEERDRLIIFGETVTRELGQLRDKYTARELYFVRDNPFDGARRNLAFINKLTDGMIGDFLHATDCEVHLVGDEKTGIRIQSNYFYLKEGAGRNESAPPVVVISGTSRSALGQRLLPFEIDDLESGIRVSGYYPEPEDVKQFGKLTFAGILDRVELGILEKIDQLEQVAANLPRTAL